MIQIKTRDYHPIIRELLSYATDIEKVDNELDQYIYSSNRALYEYRLGKDIVGVVGFELISSNQCEIKHIAVLPHQRGQSIGSKMIRFVCDNHGFSLILAETDCEAVEFYQKYGFEVVSLGEKYPGVERFKCKYKLV